ncbi:uncharacterized protein LOC121865797 [Homarus americanus]|uniref:uncharacterized protein LOC121865797 n=1 Tax=Homarus americanus TaxID=6706 RepID=UPI001C45D4CF|nr:uncharacterized protein LOC121865797 [Homarus americanus]
MQMSPMLPCNKCGKQQAAAQVYAHSGQPQTSSRAHNRTVMPFINIEFELTDIWTDKKCLVNLSCHNFRKFFGLAPQFAWTVKGINNKLLEKLFVLKNHREALFFGLTKSKTPDGKMCYNISHTTLNTRCD